MKNLSLEDFCSYYARQCKMCNGARRIRHDGRWTACSCQNIANSKWRLEQIRVHPPELKLLTWDDFTGVIKENNEQTGMLTVDSLLTAKSKALAYCYKDGDCSSPTNLILHDRANDGSNLIIGGGRHTGKTLLGVLVVKDIIRTCVVHNVNLSFEWIQSSALKDAARWDNKKTMDHMRLDELAEVDYLIIDQVELDSEKGHHTNPPDRTSMNVLFGQRDMYRRPTIIICTQKFLGYLCSDSALSSVLHEDIAQQWGNEFLNILTNKKNIIIQLEREKLSESD